MLKALVIIVTVNASGHIISRPSVNTKAIPDYICQKMRFSEELKIKFLAEAKMRDPNAAQVAIGCQTLEANEAKVLAESLAE